jgi:hypothetical protein
MPLSDPAFHRIKENLRSLENFSVDFEHLKRRLSILLP